MDDATVFAAHGGVEPNPSQQSRGLAHAGRNVLAVDLPGHGRSGGAALTSIEALAAWLDRFIVAAG